MRKEPENRQPADGTAPTRPRLHGRGAVQGIARYLMANNINPKNPAQEGREANGVKTADDIIMKMRNPGPGMNKFDEKTIPDKDAKAIAEYVLNTFKRKFKCGTNQGSRLKT
jgi:hypothetical protein